MVRLAEPFAMPGARQKNEQARPGGAGACLFYCGQIGTMNALPRASQRGSVRNEHTVVDSST